MKAKNQVLNFPALPGCYIMKDNNDRIIYVGKAKNLKKRVSSYFLPNRDAKTSALVDKIDNIEYIITGNEYEALLLENNLIKKHNPHYNILLKDGKSYAMIKITKEDFPRVYKTRRILSDGAKYFGPYPSSEALDAYLDLIKEIYSLRTCKGSLKNKKPCLYHSIGKCPAPCAGFISKKEYLKDIEEIETFLNNDSSKIIETLQKGMEKASKDLNFELAIKKRDLIEHLETVLSKQSVENFSIDNRDYVALESRSNLTTISIMQFRSGKLIGKALYRSQSLASEADSMLSFLVSYYSDEKILPDDIYISFEFDTQLIKEYFKKELEFDINIGFPKEGKHYRILKMAELNASEDVEKRLCDINNSGALEELKKYLDLDKLPSYIEGFDIAQLAGKYTTSSCIVFKNGNPSVKDYRLFNIKSLNGQIDDFGAMREALSRRYTRLINEKSQLPDLIMVDGGKGQVGAAKEILDLLDLDIPLVGLAKRNEEIVFPDSRPNLVLDKADKALRVLIALRDECHRFATTHNQRLRSKEASFAMLKSIDGIGEKRSRAIMEKLSSLEDLLSNTPEELAKKVNIPVNVAKRILDKLTL